MSSLGNVLAYSTAAALPFDLAPAVRSITSPRLSWRVEFALRSMFGSINDEWQTASCIVQTVQRQILGRTIVSPLNPRRPRDDFAWRMGSMAKEQKADRGPFRGLPDEDATSTLLHEMAHAATNGGHGVPWKREMIRLLSAGAPLANTDRVIRLDDPFGKPISKKHFRGSMADLLMDVPDMTPSVAIRLFIRTEGGPPTIAAFLRKYPWARTVFNAEKSEMVEEHKQQKDFLASYRLLEN